MSSGQPYRYPHCPCFPSPCGKLPTPIACLLQRFCLVHCFILNFLSWTLNLAKHATPFAPSPLQKLQHYYEVVRHRHGHQYFLPCVSRLSAFSLSIPCLFLLFLQRAHVKFMPSLHRTPSRQ